MHEILNKRHVSDGDEAIWPADDDEGEAALSRRSESLPSDGRYSRRERLRKKRYRERKRRGERLSRYRHSDFTWEDDD